MIDACIIGYGMVGKATAVSFGITKYFDINGEANITLDEAANCLYKFLCLPTPTVDEKCDTNIVRDTIRQLEAIRGHGIYIIRSTVIPGTANAIIDEIGSDRVVSNPEFLSEDTWLKDATRPNLVVIGADSKEWRDKIAGIYLSRFKYIEPIITNNITAEMIKYAFNTFFVTKVVFANEIYDVCARVGANYDTIKKVLTGHPWGSGNHFEVYHKGGRGAKGKCLPKDLEAFVTYSNSKLLKTVKEINDGYGNTK